MKANKVVKPTITVVKVDSKKQCMSVSSCHCSA